MSPRTAGATGWVCALAAAVVLASSCTGAPAPTPASTAAGAAAPAPVLWPRAPGTSVDDGTAGALQERLDRWRADGDAPGATAAVVTADGSWSGASGVDGAGLTLQPDTAGAVGSITKTFVAAEVLRLAGRGDVDLDAPVSAYVELPFDDGGATVRQVLGMQSGFPQDPVHDLLHELTDVDREWTAADVLGLVVPSTTQGTLGGATDYNNLNFWVLGLLVEEVAQEPLAAVLRSDLLDAADLERVWFQTAERPVPPVAVAAGEPDLPPVDGDGPYLPSRAVASAAAAAGGMAADAPSLALWGHLLYGGHVVDAALVEQMTAAEGPEDWYGLGTEVGRDEGQPVVGHGGDIGVSHALLRVWPASGTAVAVLVPAAAPTTLDTSRTVQGLVSALHEVTLP
ncbi:serine hydrolase domain-containing protein [Cellulomonas endophytica]|uniref:serine hydrolase domain-containing protein n=1 Tax=Cellulomonas endophytica TaxID=2494735 RepID=UPI0010107BF1|nr:serine hydrolase domain-containing protein [Cellulomonas endophytica]